MANPELDSPAAEALRFNPHAFAIVSDEVCPWAGPG